MKEAGLQKEGRYLTQSLAWTEAKAQSPTPPPPAPRFLLNLLPEQPDHDCLPVFPNTILKYLCSLIGEKVSKEQRKYG